MREKINEKIKIPKEEDIRAGIISVLHKYGFVKSQEELSELVLEELKQKKLGALLSPHRTRMIALEIPEIKVKVLTKKSGGEKPKNCPVCSRPLKGLYATNLLGKKVLVGLKCEQCKYKGSVRAFAPFRYYFSLLKE